MKRILSLDIGTSRVKAILIDEKGKLIGIEQKQLTTTYPFHDHIEQNPEEIFQSVLDTIEKVIGGTNTRKDEITCMGISNARETTVIWDKVSGKPVWNAILWNDNRSKEYCKKHESLDPFITQKTGLPFTSYGSATKIRWILDNAPIENLDNCLFGTLNTWTLWKLTAGVVFATDITNASRTLLFNLKEKKWDDDLLELFKINKTILPEVKSCSEQYGFTDETLLSVKIPICSMIGDAQAALFAAGCHDAGQMHCSIGTGAFLLMNTGTTMHMENPKLITSIAYQRKNEPIRYCLEGAAHSTGSVVEWLKSHLGIIRSAKEIEGLAYSVPDSGGVYFVPAITGITSPYRSEHVRGTLLGLSSSTNIGHICRALMEGISFMISDIYHLLNEVNTSSKESLKCSGGMTEDNFLLQMTSNLMEQNLLRSKKLELSAYGAAYLAGLSMGIWKNENEIKKLFEKDREFIPSLDAKDLEVMRRDWKKALSAALVFSDIKIA